MPFSKEDIAELSKAVAGSIVPVLKAVLQPQPVQAVNQQEEHVEHEEKTHPIDDALTKREMELIATLPSGTITTTSRNGRIVTENRTATSLNAIWDMRKNRRLRKEQSYTQ